MTFCCRLYFVCVRVFTWLWFCFVCRVFCSAQHKRVHLGPQQQFGGSGALHETGVSVAEARKQSALTEARVHLMPWELFCTLEASEPVQTFVSSGQQNLRREAPEKARSFVHLNSQELCGHWLGTMVCRSRSEEAGFRDDLRLS